MMQTLHPQKSIEQEEVDALTLQLMKMKQLLVSKESLLTQERSARESAERQIQQLNNELELSQQQTQQEQQWLAEQMAFRETAETHIRQLRAELDLLKQQHLQQEQQWLAEQRTFSESSACQIEQLRTELELTQQNLSSREQALIEQTAVIESMKNQREQLQIELERAKQHLVNREQNLGQLAEQQLQRNEKIENLSTQVTALEGEKLRLTETLSKTRKALDEREGDLKIAQEHIAKKVRESSRQNEQLDEAVQRSKAMQTETSNLRIQIESLKTEVARWQKRESQLLEQLNDLQITAAAKQAKLQIEYDKAVEQWKDAESQLHKLRLLEGQQQQLRAL